MLKSNSLLEHTHLFSLNDNEKNDIIIFAASAALKT